ncbi:hypothetical protein [Glutamicibacter creatinolyticus]|uniref:hypothetical protein n=1 Tax=Glutamicibacter creatinolyticus TaxID=162496 RepID=UPI0032166311
MSRKNGLILAGLLPVLLVLPPLPGYLIQLLQSATGEAVFPAGTGLGELMLNPLRLVGALLAVAWAAALAHLDPRLPSGWRYVGAFVGCGILYVLPIWLGAFGADLGWVDLWVLAGTASWYEWMQLHAPVAGGLCLWALYLMRPAPAPARPARWRARLARMLDGPRH